MTGRNRESNLQDLRRCLQLVESATDRKARVRWVRPPYGVTNQAVRQVIEELGLREMMWQVDTNDWKKPGATVIASRILGHAAPGKVILMHDGGGNRKQTVEALRRALPALLERGFSLVTLSEAKGLETPFGGEVFYEIEGRRFLVAPTVPPLRVEINGEPVENEQVPLKCEGQFLLPVLTALPLLGVVVHHDTENQTLEILGSEGIFRLRLNSLRGERDGRPFFTQFPAILYENTAYVPVATLARLSGAKYAYDPEQGLLSFTAPHALELEAAPLAASMETVQLFSPSWHS